MKGSAGLLWRDNGCVQGPDYLALAGGVNAKWLLDLRGNVLLLCFHRMQEFCNRPASLCLLGQRAGLMKLSCAQNISGDASHLRSHLQ